MRQSNILICIISILAASACEKSEFLEKKPDERLVIPKTLIEIQALLDNDAVMNGGAAGLGGVDPHFGHAASDDIYVPDDILTSLPEEVRNLYSWNDNIYNGERFYDWDFPYRAVYYANTALTKVAEIPSQTSDQDVHNNIKGSALFYRSRMFYELAQIYAPPYLSATASDELGIPLVFSPDINSPIKRYSLKETYQQIINDLGESVQLLPIKPQIRTRPSKHAAYALLAKVYLTMGDFTNSLLNANKCLDISKELMDYNVETAPFKRFNQEVIFHSVPIQQNSLLTIPGLFLVDTTLFNSYEDDDLRKTLFFSASWNGNIFQGSYEGSPYLLFSGLATDEIYLIRAECYVRTGEIATGLKDLNDLLRTRWKRNNGISTYIDKSASSAEDALAQILSERRKELVFRGTRWSDIRRLNVMDAGIVLKRVVSSTTYTLNPNELRYTYLLPPDVISFNPGMPQNDR